MKDEICCDGLPDHACLTFATVFFKTGEKYIARCPDHDAVPRSADLPEISREEFIVAQVMES